MDYREFVGPKEKYDIVGASQFCLLISLGLRDHHNLLDIGCGSLRAGRLFIPYLLPGRYCGIEPNEQLVREGLTRELGESILDVKKPSFSATDGFEMASFGKVFDFLLAQSIFSHASPSQVETCLSEASKVMGVDSVFAATFVSGKVDNTSEQWTYPGCVTYRPESMGRFAGRHGLDCKIIPWQHPNGQTWMVMKKIRGS